MNERYLLQNSLFCTVSSSLNSQNDYSDVVYSEQTYDVPVLTNLDTFDISIINEVSTLSETWIPLEILKGNSSLESIVRYLKDVSNLKFNQIARLLNRDQRTIWATYSKANAKIITKINSNHSPSSMIDVSKSSDIFLPLSIFVSRRLSVLESIVFYLRNTYSLSFNQISELMGRHYQTIKTVHNRALKKITKNVNMNYDN